MAAKKKQKIAPKPWPAYNAGSERAAQERFKPAKPGKAYLSSTLTRKDSGPVVRAAAAGHAARFGEHGSPEHGRSVLPQHEVKALHEQHRQLSAQAGKVRAQAASAHGVTGAGKKASAHHSLQHGKRGGTFYLSEGKKVYAKK